MMVLDLFAGIGGFSYGLHLAGGYETVGFVERDEFCQKVLRKNFPDVPIYGDIHNFKGDECGPIDLICGGFPCQPFSQIGRRKGNQDDRYLWPEMLRVIQRARPRWVIGENVVNFVRMGLDRATADLESEGFSVWPIVLPACAVDAPHRRDRVFIIAGNCEFLPDAICPRLERHARNGEIFRGPQWQDQEQAGSIREESLPRREHPERRWPSSAGIRRVGHGIPSRVDRLRALGNAVVPQVVAEIGRFLHEADSFS